MELLESLDYCLLPKLTKNFEESEYHQEIYIRNEMLAENFPKIIRGIEEINLKEAVASCNAMASLIILYYELQTTGPWNTEKCYEYSKKLDYCFEVIYETSLKKLLYTENIFEIQEIFDICLEKLHRKLSFEDFKKYPSLVEVYCDLVRDLKHYYCKLNPTTILPTSLLLIDDYTKPNKIKGLESCKSILQSLSEADFTEGNYYEVIYSCLIKALVEKDLEVTKLVLACFMELLKKLPSYVKVLKNNDVFSKVLEQVNTESNLYRKAALFSFTTNLIQMHGVNSVNKKKIFMQIMCDNIDICCNEAIAEILLDNILECLEEWIKHCWCVWQLSTDKKIITTLVKVLCVSKENNIVAKISDLIIIFISLSTTEEQSQITKNLKTIPEIRNQVYCDRINLIGMKLYLAS